MQAGATLVPQALARFKEVYPGVDLDLTMAESDEALAALRSGHIDLAIIAEPGEVSGGARDLKYAHLVDDPYRLVLPVGRRNQPRGCTGRSE